MAASGARADATIIVVVGAAIVGAEVEEIGVTELKPLYDLGLLRSRNAAMFDGIPDDAYALAEEEEEGGICGSFVAGRLRG